MKPIISSNKRSMQRHKDFKEFCETLDHCAKMIGYATHEMAPEYDRELLTRAFMQVMEEVEMRPLDPEDSEFEWFDPCDVAERWGQLVLEQEIEYGEVS